VENPVDNFVYYLFKSSIIDSLEQFAQNLCTNSQVPLDQEPTCIHLDDSELIRYQQCQYHDVDGLFT